MKSSTFEPGLRVRFFKKIQDWILKSERIRKRILRFFSKQINPRSFGSWCVKGTEESTLGVDSSVPLMHHDPRDLGLICLVKKRKIRFRILSDLRIQSWIFLKKRTLNASFSPLQNHQICPRRYGILESCTIQVSIACKSTSPKLEDLCKTDWRNMTETSDSPYQLILGTFRYATASYLYGYFGREGLGWQRRFHRKTQTD